MKVAILAPSPVPFMVGGAEALSMALYRELFARDQVQAELLKVPTPERTLSEVMASYQCWSELSVDQFDKVIAGKYPAWMVDHPYKVIYMLHPLRGLYDTYYGPDRLPLKFSGLALIRPLVEATAGLTRGARPADVFGPWRAALEDLGPDHPAFAFPGPLARILVRSLDRWALHPSRTRSWATISRTVASREGYFQDDQPVQPVYPPSSLQNLHHTPEQCFFFTASRLDKPKRLDLAIEAYRAVPGSLPLLVAGGGPEEATLRKIAAHDPRVQFLGRISEESLADHYARALAVVFVPQEEDLGLIALEAMSSGKPVLTCTDSGGPTEFITDGVNGLVVEPSREALASAFRQFLEDPARAGLMGLAGRDQANTITWRSVADALLTRPAPQPRRPRTTPARRARQPKPRAVFLGTQSVEEPRGGGALRARHLAEALAPTYNVDLICLVHPRERRRDISITPSLRQRQVPRSAEHEESISIASVHLSLSTEDVLAGSRIRQTPDYLEVLDDSLRGASRIVLSHPYLAPALREVAETSVPILYDAADVEFDQKSAMAGESPLAGAYIRLVRRTEGVATAVSSAVTCTSDADAARLAELYLLDPAKVQVIPNGVDLTRTPFVDRATRAANRQALMTRLGVAAAGHPTVGLFIGSAHPPNTQAARVAVDLARDMPDLVLLIAGSVCWTLNAQDRPPNVVPLGVLTDDALTALLASVDCALNPMLSGAGTNLKFIQYLAAGIPIVSTEFGARGVAGGEAVACVSPPEEFAGAIRAIQEGAIAEDRLRQGRQIAEVYSWPRIGQGFLATIESLEDSP